MSNQPIAGPGTVSLTGANSYNPSLSANTVNNDSTQSVFGKLPSEALEKQKQQIIDGKDVPVDLEIINAWNIKRKMSALDISTLSPFVVIFIVLDTNLKPLIENRYGKTLQMYQANLGGKRKILVPLAMTRNVYETTNFAGGLGITNFTIGYEKTLTQLTGNFSFSIPTLDDFDEDFSAAAMLTPYNILLTMHGWSGPGIFLNLPWNLAPNEIWESDLESLNKGWWSINSVYMYKRTFNHSGNGYEVTCDFGQMYNAKGASGQDPTTLNQLEQDFTIGSSININDALNKTKILSNINNVYNGGNVEYIKNFLNNSWFIELDQYLKEFSVSRKNENGEEEFVTDTVYYPLGIVLEAIMSVNYDINQNTFMKIKYGVLDSSKWDDLKKSSELPAFRFTLSNGKDNKTFEIPVASTFDIPISKKSIEKILSKPQNKWGDHIKDILDLAPSNFKIALVGNNHTIDDKIFTHELRFSDLLIDKEVLKNNPINETSELILDYRSPNSLMGEVSMQASDVGLEKLSTPLIWNSLTKNGIRVDTKEDPDTQNKETTITKPLAPTDKDDDPKYQLNDSNNEFNNQILTEILSDKSKLRGFLIRSLSQVITVDVHGLAGLIPIHTCFVRGLSTGMNGRHVILKVLDTVTPSNYTTNLRLANVQQVQDLEGFNKTEDNIDSSNTSNTGITKKPKKKIANESVPGTNNNRNPTGGVAGVFGAKRNRITAGDGGEFGGAGSTGSWEIPDPGAVRK
jgi:hypothetical protein